MSNGPADFAIIVLAAGTGTRMGFDKVWADLDGRPLVAHALGTARQVNAARIVLVVARDRFDAARALAPDVQTVVGGSRRRDSVAAGLAACQSTWIGIHDAARVFVTSDLFERGLSAAQATGASIPVTLVKDTIKRLHDGYVVETLDRAGLGAVQTPQVFRRDLLERALESTEDDVTDEAALLERMGIQVATFMGDERNFKVTTPLDYELARSLLRSDHGRS